MLMCEVCGTLEGDAYKEWGDVEFICEDCFDKQMQEWKKEQEHLEWEYWDSVL